MAAAATPAAAARSPEAGAQTVALQAASVRKPALRVGGRVVTRDGFFAKIVGLSGDDKDAQLLDLEIAGIGLRAGVPASQVTTSDRRSVPLSPRRRRSLSPAGALRQVPKTTARAGHGRAASSAPVAGLDEAPQDLDASLEEETERFKQTSDAFDSILAENMRLQSSLEEERKLFGSPLKDADSGPEPAHSVAPIALSFSSPTKARVVPILKLPGAGARREEPSPVPESPSMGCLSPRVASTLGEQRRHLHESASKAESLSDTVGTISHGVSAWKEAIERDRKEHEEWRRSAVASPRTPRSTRAKNEITPLKAREPVTSTVLSSISHGPPGPRTPRSPRQSQTHAQQRQTAAEFHAAAVQHAECASPGLPEQDVSSSSSHSPTPSPQQARQAAHKSNRHLHASASKRAGVELLLTPSHKRGALELGSPIASPGGDFTSRVRSRALANLLHKGRRSSIVIYCFDAWRMLMYCRIQHDLGKEETLLQQLQFERDLTVYRQQLEVMSQQQKEEREMFMHKQNQEREVFIQMIAMLSQTNAQLQTSCAQLQAQTACGPGAPQPQPHASSFAANTSQAASAAHPQPLFAPAAQETEHCAPDLSSLLAVLSGTANGPAPSSGPGHLVPPASAARPASASAVRSPVKAAGIACDYDEDDEVTIRGSPFCSAAAAVASSEK